MRRTFIAMVVISMFFVGVVQARTLRPAAERSFRGWKTYRNARFGFKFQYPKQLSLIDYAADPNQQQFLADQPVSGTQPPLLDLVEVLARNNRRVFSVKVPNQKKFPVVSQSYDWSLRACGEVGFQTIKSKEKTLLAGYPTLKVTGNLWWFHCINFPRQPVIIYFPAKSGRLSGRILSTFRFLK